MRDSPNPKPNPNPGYYCAHRWMHTRRMYWAHRFHHRFNSVVVPVTANAVTVAGKTEATTLVATTSLATPSIVPTTIVGSVLLVVCVTPLSSTNVLVVASAV